jgi:hypothetical protein
MRTALSNSRPRAGRPALPAALLLALSLLLSPLVASAGADVGTKIIERCTHGKSLSGFSQQAYRRALQELPTEVEEYSDCANLIRRAQLAAAGGRGGLGGGGGGSSASATPLSPSERGALKRVPKTGSSPLRVGGQLVHPGVVHASALSSLPDPLLAILAFLLACALALSGRSIQNGVRAYRAD